MNKQVKGKAIIGIAIAVIMLATLMAMIPAVSAKDVSNQYLTLREPANLFMVNPAFVAIEMGNTTLSMMYYQDFPTDSVKIGQELIFNNTERGDVVLIEGIADTNTDGEAFSASAFVTEAVPKVNGVEGNDKTVEGIYFDTTSMGRTGTYILSCKTKGLKQALSVSRPIIPIELKVGPDVVSTITVGTKLKLDCSGISDLDPYDCVDLEITDPDGRQIKTWTAGGVTQYYDEINVRKLIEYGSSDVTKQIDTTDWLLGPYSFHVITEEENARGLDLASATKTLGMLKGEVDIDIDKTEVGELESVTVTVTGIYGNIIHVEATAGEEYVEFEEGLGDFVDTFNRLNTRVTDPITGRVVIDPMTGMPETHTYGFDVVMEEDGQMEFSVRFHDAGAYTIEVLDFGPDGIPRTSDDEMDEDTVDVKVAEKEVVFDMPSSVVIGDDIEVRGTAKAGDYIDIAIDDYIVYINIPVAADGTFAVDLQTPETRGTGAPGSIVVEAFIRVAGVESPALYSDISDIVDVGSVKLYIQNDAGGGIDVAASDVNVGKNETIILSVSAMPGHNVSVTTADPVHTVFEYNSYDFTGTSNNIISIAPADTISIPIDIEDCDSQADTINSHGVWKTMDEDGIIKFGVHFTDSGTYKITATDYGMDYSTATRLDEESIEILVSVTFDVPPIVVIGNRIKIRGTANAGDYVDIAIEDHIIYAGLPIEPDGTFEVDIPTPWTRATGGQRSILIEAFIRVAGDPELRLYKDISDMEDDGSTEVFLVGGWLTANLSIDTVDLGDKFMITGTAPGSGFVDIVTIAPNGGSGIGINPGNIPTVPGITHDSSAVSGRDHSFLKMLYVDEDADTGRYLVIVVSPGRNRVYDKINDDHLFGNAFEEEYGDILSLGSKTQDQLLTIIKDETIDVAGSDDHMWVGTINVGDIETLILNPIADVVVGNPLDITGETSRNDGSIIWITVKGLYQELVPQAAIVKDNVFNATFDTTGARQGTYTVNAIDGDGYTATTSVNIIVM